MTLHSLHIVILRAPNLPSDSVPLWGGLARVLPPVSLWFWSKDGFPIAKRMLPTAKRRQAICAALAVWAQSMQTAIRTFSVQHTDCYAQ